MKRLLTAAVGDPPTLAALLAARLELAESAAVEKSSDWAEKAGKLMAGSPQAGVPGLA